MGSASTDDKNDPLDHPRRKRIYQLVRSNPGLNWNQIQRKADISVGALLFHLERLEVEEVILRRPGDNENEALFFTPENVELWRDPRTRVLFGNESTRKVARAIAEAPGSTVKELAEDVDVHPVTVRYHIDKLEDHELVESEQDGRAKIYRPADRLSRWIERVEAYAE